MKLIRKLAPIILSVILCGCSLSVEELLSPPKLNDEQSAIYEALRSSKGGDIHLKYPRSGQYRSAFVVNDIDEEETAEAIVFYEASNVTDGGSSLRLNFLDMEDGEWVSVYDFAALGSEVEKVQFSDLGDGETSIIITYTIQNSSDSAASVLKFEDGVPTEVYKGRFAYMEIMDINGNGHNELFQITRDLDSGAATAALLGWSDGEHFQILSSAPLSGFSECRHVTLGACDSDGYKALFIDYLLSGGNLGTDVLVCYNTRLSPAPQETISRRINSFTPDIMSQDIDADGIIEIPSTSVATGYENMSKPEQVNTVSWYQLEAQGSVINREYLTYVSIRSDYMLVIPTRWEGRVTINISISEEKVTFSEYDSVNHIIGDELLAIKAVTDSAEEPKGFESFGKSENTGYRFFIKSNSNNSLALTGAELEDCFRIIG